MKIVEIYVILNCTANHAVAATYYKCRMVISMSDSLLENEQPSSYSGNTGITQGVIWKQLLFFFFPMLLGSILQLMYNTIDAAIVGKFLGKEALSAVGGTTGTILNLLVGFFIALSSGVTVTIAQFYGARKSEEVSKTVHTAFAIAVSGGLFVAVFGIIIAPHALVWMDTPPEVYPMSLTYLRVVLCGSVSNLVYNVGAGILRAVGDSRRPLYFLSTSVLINVVLDLFFIINLNMGVAGAALATIIAQTVSAFLVCLSLVRTQDSIKLYIKKIRFYKQILRRILVIGMPAAFQNLMYTTSNIFIQSFVNSFGTNTIAAWTSYAKIDAFFWAISSSFGISLTTFVGQNYGAGKIDRIKKSVLTCLGMLSLASVTISVVLYFFGGYVLKLFNDDPAVIEKGVEIIRFLVPTYITFVCVEIFSGTLRGLGNTVAPLIMTALGVPGIRMLWLFFGPQLFPGFRNVVFSYPLTWSITSLMFIIYMIYFTRKKSKLSPVTL